MRDRDSDPPPLTTEVVTVEGGGKDAHEVRNLLQILIGQVGIARRLALRGDPVVDALTELEETVLALAAAATRRQGA